MIAWQLALLGVRLLVQLDAVEAKADRTCPNENDSPASPPQALMQVGSERRSQHPGSGHVVPLEPEDAPKRPQTHEKESKGLLAPILTLEFIGIDVSELALMPMIRDTEFSGLGGTVAFFALLLLVLVCLLAVVACFNEEKPEALAVQGFEAKKLARLQPGGSRLSSTTTAVSSRPATSATTWSQPSSTLPSWQDSAVAQQPAEAAFRRPQGVQVEAAAPLAPQAKRPQRPMMLVPFNAAEDISVERAFAYLPEEDVEGGTASSPPMVSAVPRRGEGGVNLPIADDLDDTLDSTYSQPAPSPQEAAMAPSPYPSPNLAGLEVPEVIEPRPVLSDNFDVSTLCPGMILDHGKECAMAVPIPGEDITEASMTILDPANGEPLLKAEVFRGSECEAPPNFSPMIGDDWPPENYWPHSSDRGSQHPSILLTTLPMNIPRSDDEDNVNEDAGENVQNHSSCYLVHADEQSLEFDIYNGNGVFWGRMGRDHSRSCRFMMRGGNFGEVRYFVDGVFEDHAVLFTDMLQDTIADGEALELADLAFGEASEYMHLWINGTEKVDAGLILTMLFCAYELRSLGA